MIRVNLKEHRRVTVTFADEDDAIAFKQKVQQMYNFPEKQTRYQVVHGSSESGKAVFVEHIEFNPSALRRLTEETEKLEEANWLKKAIVAAGILFTLGSGLSAQSLKDKGDWDKSWNKCKKELTAEYGKGGTIPKKDAAEMAKALKQNNYDEVKKEWEDTGGYPTHWFMDNKDCADNVKYVLGEMGFTIGD